MHSMVTERAVLERIGVTLLLLLLGGCAIKDEVKDGLWEIRAKVSTAALTVDESGQGQVDFTFVYLLGLVDDEGIEQVDWTFALIDSDRNELAAESQVMRQGQADQNEVFVQGERPRSLMLDGAALSLEETYVLWITVRYRDTVLTEVLVPVTQGQIYLNEREIGDIPQLSTR